MTNKPAPSLLVAVAVLLLGAVVTVALTTWSPSPPPAPVVVAPDGAAPEPVAPATQAAPELVADQGARAEVAVSDSLATTVVWPLEVRFELLADASLPEVPAGPPLGSGRDARLAGRIADASGDPVRASVRFTDGANAGRVLACDANGRFGADDLYPGMAIVEVRGPGIVGSRREVRLRSGAEELLNVGYGRPGSVSGLVLDEDGEPIPGARVSLDGQEAESDEQGRFAFLEVAAGRCLFEVEREGFAAYRTILGVASAFALGPDDLKVVLRRPASLRLVLRPDIGGPGPALVYLMPAHSQRERSFPWHTVNPIELTGESPVVVQDLPAGALHVRAYRTGAVARPEYRQVYLNPGQETEAVLFLEPAPVLVGVALGPQGAVAGARVRLSAADPTRASQRHFPSSDQLWLEHVLPLMPAAVQEVEADASGRFRLTSWSNLSPFRLLEATSPDGALSARIVVGPETDDRELELRLVPSEERTARFVARLPGRRQALPVEVRVEGSPRDPFVLGARDDLVVDGLVPGTYRVTAAWYGERVALEDELPIEDGATVTWDLPQGAIDGQPEEVWRKLGRPYPGEAADGDGAGGE